MKARFLGLVVLAIFALSIAVMPALAHEGREVGEFLLEFGWRNEPALSGLFNGPEIFIEVHDAPEGTPFPEDIEVNLQAEVTFGPETTTLPLRAAWGETGHYIADLIPTMPGDYSFRVFGTIGDTEVNETFSSSDGEFSSVEPGTDIMFPVAGITDTAAIQARIDDLEARIAALEAK